MNTAAAASRRYPWMVVALLVPVALLNYLDRQMLASMKFSVMRDISDIGLEANWGAILALFKWVYAFLSPIGGYIADRYSKRYVIAGSLLVWSSVTWATGHVATYDQLLLTRALMGISEAFYIPAALALISEVHTGHTRSRAVGLHQMGIYVGVIIGGFGGYAADHPALGLVSYRSLIRDGYALSALVVNDSGRPGASFYGWVTDKKKPRRSAESSSPRFGGRIRIRLAPCLLSIDRHGSGRWPPA